MDGLPLLKPKSRFQQLKGWLKNPFKGWFNSKDVRVLSNHAGASLEPTPGWQHRQQLHQRNIDEVSAEPIIAPPEPDEEEDELMTAIEIRDAALKELQAHLKQQVFDMQLEAYRNSNRNLLIVLQKLKGYSSQNNWQKVSEILRHHMPLLGVKNFDAILAEYQRINTMELAVTEPVSAGTPPAAYQPQPAPLPLHLKNPDTPAAIPSAAGKLTQLDNGQVNLFLGDITTINQKVHPPVETLVCPHRGDPTRLTTILEQLKDLEPRLKDRVFMDRMQQVDSGTSIITEAGNIARRGFSSVVHTVLPERWDSQPNARLLSAYVSAIRQAHNRGASSIAIPILSRYMKLSPRHEAMLAHRAIQYYLNHPDTPADPPKIFLVFPDNPQGRKLHDQHFSLNLTRPLINFAPDNQVEHNRVLRLRLERILDPILPPRDGLNIAGRMDWLAEAVDRSITLLEQHQDLGDEGAGLLAYFDEAKERLRNHQDQLNEDEFVLAQKFLVDLEEKLNPYIHYEED